MADLYVRSTDGSNSDNGSTWALAKATVAGAMAIDAAGDNTYISQAHAESTAADTTWACGGTNISPSRIIGVNDAAAPPTAVSTTATITTTGASDLNISGSVYIYGLTFNIGTGATRADFVPCAAAGDVQKYEQCTIALVNTGASATIYPGGGVERSDCIFQNVNLKFAATNQRISGAGRWRWTGGAIVSGSSTPNPLIGVFYGEGTNTAGGASLIENVDFSNFASTLVLTAPPPPRYPVIFRNCKLPASWSGTFLSAAFSYPGRVEMYNCAAGATNYQLWIEDYYGTIRDETTIVRTGGASDGVTPIAWKMSGGARNSYPTQVLESPEICIYNAATGSAKTVTVEILRDSVTNLTDKEVWLEVRYLGSSATPVGSSASDCAADFLTAAADQTTSAETWTTTGLANPNKQKLSVTFTPQMKGYFLCRVMLAKASTTIYVDPKATVS